MSNEAGWGLAGIVVGGLLTGGASVYVEHVKSIRDDVRFRTQKAEYILETAAGAVGEFAKREVQSRENPPPPESVAPIEPDRVAIEVASHFPGIAKSGKAFEQACAAQFSKQHAIFYLKKNEPMETAKINAAIDQERDELGKLEAAQASLREDLIHEVVELNRGETAWTPASFNAP